jgi:metallophosphoesterase (TIGR03768 family)
MDLGHKNSDGNQGERLSHGKGISRMRNRCHGLLGLICVVMLQLQLAGSGCVQPPAPEPEPAGQPISKDVFTTVQQQILPIALPADTPRINPADVPLYETFGYSAWQKGPGLPYVKRAELAPAYNGASNAARLLSFFAMTDIHITDKESPAQPINPGWSAQTGEGNIGGTTVNMSSSYSPIILSTTQVLDAAVQTINALHEHSPCDFMISLGDNINNHQYNELRWFIDVLDGQVITPSSGAHVGADTIDYQKPYTAAGLDPAIPWYQVIGNHDQYWSGVAYENQDLQDAHVGSTIINMCNTPMDPNCINETGFYMGVVDGSTIYGDVIGAGPESLFPVPPTVVPDDNRHSLSTSNSASLNWMSEFFNTTSTPVGHGFTQANLDNDFACYTFEPKSDIPIKVIVLDNTNKRNDALASPAYYGTGGLDQTRLDWLTDELQKGQDENKLMIIAAHIPIKPQASLTDQASTNGFYDHDFEDSLLATLHTYPNLILWIAGHRHINVVTPLPSADPANHPEQSFWEVETAALRDFPQQLRSFDIRRNSDNTISILVANVDTAVVEDTPAAKSRGYAIGAARIFGGTNEVLANTSSQAYNAELVKQLTPAMQTIIAHCGSPIQ